MKIEKQIEAYIDSLPAAKREDVRQLHNLILSWIPPADLWFLDGKDAAGKIVSNPNIGYGNHELKYADGSVRPFYKVGISANSAGLSIYLMGLPDKHILVDKYQEKLGKATITGYCIKFKKLADIDLEQLKEVMVWGFNVQP